MGPAVCRARFDRLISEASVETARYRGDIDGGGELSLERNVLLKHVELVRTAADRLELRATHNGHLDTDFGRFMDFPRQTTFEATPTALGLPADWRGYARLRMTVENGPLPLTLELIVVGARGRIPERRALVAGQVATFEIDLIDLPLVQGDQPEFEPTGVRLAWLWEDAGGPRGLTVRALELLPEPEGRVRPCVDAFGQRINADWPGKVRDVEDLRRKGAEERRELEAQPDLPERGRFGGWTGGPRFAATGFFRVERDDAGRWWYADPEGYPFWSAGVTGVRYSDDTPIDGRAFLFAELPDPKGTCAAAYGHYVPMTGARGRARDTLSFYRLNLLRKWGGFEAWRDHVVLRFRKWGYNTVANWSCDLMRAQQTIPHVSCLSTRGPIECHLAGGFFDVFDPRWERFFEDECATGTAPEKGNPWLIGWFVDNEKGWTHMRLLEAAPDAAIRAVWLALAQERYAGDLARLNADLGAAFASWEAVRAATEAQIPKAGAGRALRDAFEDRYTEAYFSKVRAILKRHDPDHLYLGCRFVRNPPREALVRIAGKHVDVMSVNAYSLVPERDTFEQWHRWSGRPVQIGEHQLSMFGARQLPQLWTTFTPEERREWYPRYEETFARMPFSLGAHWFQYSDQCLTGRPSNGENQIIGVVDITDAPHPEMAASAREIGVNIYTWHMQSV